MHEYYIGLMSGTSMDAVDAALVDFAHGGCELVATHREPLPEEFKYSLAALASPSENELNRFGTLDQQLGLLFSTAVNHLLAKQKLSASNIIAIGSHGQTVRHHPNHAIPFTLQIADPNVIAEHTNITTIADFRRRDVASGGQGAPLTPLFHAYAFYTSEKNRMVLNLGGIANLTLLPKNQTQPIIGFDTGPANTLLDNWAKHHLLLPYDANGEWARSGKLMDDLFNACLDDPYFHAVPPKSTGREYFNLNWLQKHLPASYQAVDVQRTLVELTARSVMDAIHFHAEKGSEILVCGGGIHNKFLWERLLELSGSHSLHSTEAFGIPPDWLEAIAFAWFAKQTLSRKPGNLPSVTGARREVVLGGVYFV